MNIRGIRETRHLYVDGHLLSSTISMKVAAISDGGFDWGNESAGAGQAAVAILLLATHRKEALELHELFRCELLSVLPEADFDMDVDLTEWLEDARELRRRQNQES